MPQAASSDTQAASSDTQAASSDTQAASSDVLLYADDTCLIYRDRDTKAIEDQLNENFYTGFYSPCEWFINNKLSVHFGEEKKTRFFLR